MSSTWFSPFSRLSFTYKRDSIQGLNVSFLPLQMWDQVIPWVLFQPVLLHWGLSSPTLVEGTQARCSRISPREIALDTEIFKVLILCEFNASPSWGQFLTLYVVYSKDDNSLKTQLDLSFNSQAWVSSWQLFLYLIQLLSITFSSLS